MPSQFVEYAMDTFMFVAPTVEHVRPVVRPDFATVRLTDAACPFPPLGAPGKGTPLASVLDPSRRILPLELTAPEATCAIAASTVAEEGFCRLKEPCVKLATVAVP